MRKRIFFKFFFYNMHIKPVRVKIIKNESLRLLTIEISNIIYTGKKFI